MARGKTRRNANPSARARAQHLADELLRLKDRYHDQTTRFNTVSRDYYRLKKLEHAIREAAKDPIEVALKLSDMEWHHITRDLRTPPSSDQSVPVVVLEQLMPVMAKKLLPFLISHRIVGLSRDTDPITRHSTISLRFPGPVLGGPPALG